MISIIITTFREVKTIRKVVERILNQRIKGSEVIVVSPDLETRDAIKDLIKKKKVIHVQDEGKGKPAALNIALKKAKGEIIILTDGDVLVGEKSLEQLLIPFKDPKVGLVTGRPVSVEEKDNMFGFWSYVLTDIAHRMRLKSKFVVASGYLFTVRKKLLDPIPEDALAEDAVISHWMVDKGFKTIYVPEAVVFVKFPKNFKDWIKQKKRSTGGYLQLKQFAKTKKRMRSFGKEAGGINLLWKYPTSFKRVGWLLLLILARIYLWFVIFIDVKLKRKSFKQIWVRVESTK
ncbi:MAG: glycosyltransferase [Candidatus Nanoarchaeia archaeon]